LGAAPLLRWPRDQPHRAPATRSAPSPAPAAAPAMMAVWSGGSWGAGWRERCVRGLCARESPLANQIQCNKAWLRETQKLNFGGRTFGKGLIVGSIRAPAGAPDGR